MIEDDFGASPDTVYDTLKDDGILTRRYFYPLITSFAMYRNLDSAAPAPLPHANAIAERILCLPVYPGLSRDAQARIVAAIVRSGERNRSSVGFSTSKVSIMSITARAAAGCGFRFRC